MRKEEGEERKEEDEVKGGAHCHTYRPGFQ